MGNVIVPLGDGQMASRGGFRAIAVAIIIALVALMAPPTTRAADATFLWIRQFGTNGGDQAFDVAVDSTGEYVVGWTFGNYPPEPDPGSEDAFVRKYDPDGNVLWTRQFGGISYDAARSVAINASSVYVVGTTHLALPGQTGAGEYDAWVRKYDPDGNEGWTRQFGSAANDGAGAVAADSTGVYVVGSTDGTLPGETSAGDRDALIRKYDPDGNVLWTRQFGTSTYDSIGDCVALDPTGLYVAGYTGGIFPGQTGAGGYDAWLRKYDSDGALMWTRQFGTAGYDGGYGVAGNSSGLYVGGITNGTFPGEALAGQFDAFVRKYDGDGNTMWTREFGTAAFDDAKTIFADESGVYPAGRTNGTFPGEASMGGWDAFVRKYDANGNANWTLQFGTAAEDAVEGVAADSSVVYVAGYTWGALPGQTNRGFHDPFLAKVGETGNGAPTIALTRPDGIARNNWTGGSAQLISWAMDDPNDPTTQLTVYLNYSYNGGASTGVIAGPLLGQESFLWTVPFMNATDVWIQVEVFDPSGLRDSYNASIPVVDSTRPDLTTTNPDDGATNIDPDAVLVLVFDEAMNRTATEGAITIVPGPVTTTSNWDPGNKTLLLDPTGPLRGGTRYTITVDCAAADASDPGNPLANCPRFFAFTTAGGSPPVIDVTSPDGGEVWTGGSAKDVAWTMTDADTPGNLSVDIHYSTDGGTTYPNSIRTGLSLGQGANNWGWTVPAIDSNTARVRVCASDGVLMSCDSSTVDFGIDSTRPFVVSRSPSPSETNVLVSAPIVVTFSESMATLPTEGAFTTSPDVGGMVYAWSRATATNDTLTVFHSDFGACLSYSVTIGTGVSDLSDPGNGLATEDSWTFTTACAPQVAISSPVGAEDWSGGSIHTIDYATADPDSATLDVTIEVSVDDGVTWNPVASLPGQPPGVYADPWTVPTVDTTTASLRVCASDRTNPPVCEASGAFTIDSTLPTVVSTDPADGETGVPLWAPVIITFSEPMNFTGTIPAISVSPRLTGPMYTWGGGDSVLAIHHDSFEPCTRYTVTLEGAGVKDASDPANAMASDYTWSFTTACAPIVTLASPAGGEVWAGGGLRDVTFMVTSTDAAVTVWVSLSVDGGAAWASLRPPSTEATGTAVTLPVTMPSATDTTNALVRVTAQDSNRLDGVATSAPFTIDSTPPSVTGATADPPSRVGAGSVAISATVTDNVAVAGVFVDVTQPDGTHVNRTMTPGADDTYSHDATWGQAGAHAFVVWASDTAGHWSPSGGSFTVQADTTPPSITPSGPESVFVGETITIEARATDPDSPVQEVRLVYTPVGGTEQNVSMTISGVVYTYTIPAQSSPGVIRFRVYAVDPSGNARLTREYAIEVRERPSGGGLDVTQIALVALILAVAAGAGAMLVVRKRRKKGETPPAPPR